MNAITRQLVETRAHHRCEYCHMPQSAHIEKFSVDHIIPRKHSGSDDLANLALSCLRCNRHKGTNISGLDPVTGALTTLFNPRREIWLDHIRWHGARAMGITAVGRVTVDVLCMNAPVRVTLREHLIAENQFQLD